MLLEYLREERALLVLDNLETLMEEGEGLGRLRPGYEDYARRLRRVAETGHKSCLLALLLLQRGDLRGFDLSRLALRGVHLQGVEMQDANLSGAMIQDSAFTETFDATWAVAISGNGQYWAAASKRGK